MASLPRPTSSADAVPERREGPSEARREGSSDARRAPASERLIQAALEMFSRRGMAATTREIAELAGVNEVTLFRLFESKDQLLAAVVQEVVRDESEALDRVDLDHFDLKRDIPQLARVFYQTHEKYQAFLRTMLAHRMHPKLTEQIMRRVIQPLKEKFIAYLREGQRCKAVRADIELSPAVDAFTGMIFASALRRAVYAPGYTPETYLATCTEIFIRGIQSGSTTRCDDASKHLHS